MQLETIRQAGIIAILRKVPQEKLDSYISAVVKGGVTVLEMTMDSPGVLQSIEHFRQLYDGPVFVGAGTVLSVQQAEEAVAAGAQFLVSPNVDRHVIAAAQRLGVPIMPGVLTPTEIATAKQEGVKIVKLFPARVFGPKYLSDLRGPFADMEFIPTGGVDYDNAMDFIHAGAVGVGIGSSLLGNAEQGQDAEEWIAQKVQRLLAAIMAV